MRRSIILHLHKIDATCYVSVVTIKWFQMVPFRNITINMTKILLLKLDEPDNLTRIFNIYYEILMLQLKNADE